MPNKRMNIWMPEDARQELEQAGEKTGLNLSQIIVMLIRIFTPALIKRLKKEGEDTK